MPRLGKLQVLLQTLVLFSLIVSASADVPPYISYQGRLTDSDGAPLPDGDYLIEFTIYGSSSGSDVFWTSGSVSIKVRDGLFDAELGKTPMNPLPDDLFSGGPTRYLGVTVEANPEQSPRTQIGSSPYAYSALRADTADYAHSGVATGWVDDGTEVVLENSADRVGIGVGSPGNRLHVEGTGTTHGGIPTFNEVVCYMKQSSSSYHSALTIDAASGKDPVIYLAEDSQPMWGMRNDASRGNKFELRYHGGDEHTTPLISVDSLGGIQYAAGNLLMRKDGIRMKDTLFTPYQHIMDIDYDLNTTSSYTGLHIELSNSESEGDLTGIECNVVHNTSNAGEGTFVYGVNANIQSNQSDRHGVVGQASPYDPGVLVGLSTGVMGLGYGGSQAIGVYGFASAGTTNWAGYFDGNLRVVGSIDDSKSEVIMDHPLDPENKYLRHSTVVSPDMKTVYDGTVVLDASGAVTVQLPDYFETLNGDYRYQLTAIGAPAPSLHIAEEISENYFTIAGGEPGMKVSWQITGIRHDPYAKLSPTQVEIDKGADETGLFVSPEAYGLGEEKHINHKNRMNIK